MPKPVDAPSPFENAGERLSEMQAELAERVAEARSEFEARVAAARTDFADVFEIDEKARRATRSRSADVDWRTAFARARADAINSSVAALLYNVGGILAFVGYVKLIFGIDFITEHPFLVVNLAVGGMVVGNVKGFQAARRFFRFLRSGARAKSEAELRALIDPRLQREVLNAPAVQAGLDFLIWVVIGVILTGAVLYLEPGSHHRVFLHIFMGSVFTGELVSIFVFYHLEAINSRNAVPLILGDLKVSDVPGLIRVPTWVRIMLFFLTTSLIPLVYVLLFVLLDEPSTHVLAVAVGTVLLLGVWQMRFILRSISGPIGRLARLFERVRRGETVPPRTGIYRTDALGRFAEMFEDLLRTTAERDRIRQTFGQYVNPKIAEAILAGKVPLGGIRQEATVLFADIRGFTRLSEDAAPEKVLEFLNDYHQRMVRVISHHEGIVDKFVGDGILAVWGVPLAVERHRELAVRAAFAMLEVVAGMNERASWKGERLDVGIAIHAGPVIAGNVGSAEKMEFGVLGDTVNTCARMENENRELGTVVTISREVFTGLPPDLRNRFAGVPGVTLRGKSQSVSLYRAFP